MSPEQLSLLVPTSTLPEGFAYREEFVSADEAAELVPRLAELELKEFEFHGYLGKRRDSGHIAAYRLGSPERRRASGHGIRQEQSFLDESLQAGVR